MRVDAPAREDVPVTNRITFLGHATVLFELGGTRLITDPLLRRRFLVVRRQVELPAAAHLERIDAVLLSHLHPDHLDFPSLRALGGDARLVVGTGAGRILRRRGFERVTELSPGGAITVGEVEIVATRAAHDGRRLKLGRRVEAVGFHLRGPGTSVYFAGDTDLFPEMEELAGRVDVAMLPIGGWGPSVGDGHLDPRRAAEAAAIIRPRVVVPIHWGTYMRSDMMLRKPELLRSYAGEFEAEIAARAPGVEIQVLEPNESLDLPPLAFDR
jgi:L-ascorbate metabolism protein UlaG (beta-lactamase superfamily)